MKKENQATTVDQLPTHFVFHHDAGHGWLEVTASTLSLLKLQDQVTGFSYQQNGKVYLEEDLDAIVFAKAYLLYTGKKEDDFVYFNSLVTGVYDGHSSFIRHYNRYEKPFTLSPIF